MTGVIIRGSGPREGFPDHRVLRCRRDKVGVLNGVVERRFKVGDSNQRIRPEWLDQGLAPDPGWGIPCVDCEVELKDGHAIVTYFYEGQESDYSFEADAVIYELDPTQEDEPIELHPAFAELKEKYGWDDTLNTFPEFIQGTAATKGAGFSAESRVDLRNPLAGIQTWRVCGYTFRRTYSRKVVPPSVYRNINKVISAPEGIEHVNFPEQPTRGWLRLAPRVQLRGNVAQITEEALLGKPGGKIVGSIIYDPTQIDTRPPSRRK